MKHRVLFGLVICVITAIAVTVPANAHWITDEDPEIIDDYQTSRWQNTRDSSMNRDCEHVFEQLGSSTRCKVTTNFGDFYGTELARPGTNELGSITGVAGTPIPIPQSDNLFSARYQGTFQASYLYFYEAVEHDLSSEFLWGSIRHNLDQNNRQLLEKSNGTYGLIDNYSISFSTNGRWMLGRVGDRLVRVNTTDGSEYYFGSATIGGDSSGLKTAISSDGEYAFVSNHVGQYMRLYRLSDCTLIDSSSKYHDCPYTLISDSLEEDGYTPIYGTHQVRFLRNSTLYLHFWTGVRFNTEAHTVLLTAPGSSGAEFDYLALGDSFASGEGAYNYRPETDSSQNTCRISRDSYSYLLRNIVGLDSFASVACSGAVINDVFIEDTFSYSGQIDDTLTEDRLDGQNEAFLSSFYPGHLNQSTFVEEYAPEYITVSAIGNDIGFDDIIKRCVAPGTCYSSVEDRLELSHEINSHIPRLTSMLEGLQKRGHHDAIVYAIGYPQIVKEGGDCGINVRLNADEVAFANRLIDYINAVIDIAARRSGAVYVDVSDAFSGSKLCEPTDFPAMHGITAGYDTPEMFGGPFGKESYHPTAFGHDLLANRIRQRTDSFTATAEPIDNMAWFADPAVVTDFLGSSPDGQTNRPLYITHHESNLSPDYGVYGEKLPILTSQRSNYRLEPNSVFEVWLHSEPILLGTIESDDNGIVDGEVMIPEGEIDRGYHTLRLEGENVAREQVAIHKTIFVSDTDYSNVAIREHECENANGFLIACDPEPEIMPDIDQEDGLKPPVDNPETEAGNEQPNEQHPDDETSQPETAATDSNNQPTQTTTAQNSNHSTNIATESQLAEDAPATADDPQVAGAVSQNETPRSPPETTLAAADNQPGSRLGFVLLALPAVALLLALYIKSRNKKPAH